MSAHSVTLYKRNVFSAAFLTLSLLLVGCGHQPDPNKYTRQDLKVEIVAHDVQFTLLRNGEPYFIKGAAGYDQYDRLKRYGGNSVRVWHTDNAQ